MTGVFSLGDAAVIGAFCTAVSTITVAFVNHRGARIEKKIGNGNGKPLDYRLDRIEENQTVMLRALAAHGDRIDRLGPGYQHAPPPDA